MKNISAIDKYMTVVVLLFLVWVMLPTSLFIKPISTLVEGHHVTFVRETPFGDVTAQYRHEITLLKSKFECNSGGQWLTVDYQDEELDTVEFRLPAWADECVEAEEPYILRTTRRVVLFGLIPLRQQQTTVLVDPALPDRAR